MAFGKSFGEELRAQRVSQGLTYGTVSRALKIRPDVVAALEDEDFGLMPPRSYAVGMVRSYATYLHLNPDQIVREYEEALSKCGGNAGSYSKGRATVRDRNSYSVHHSTLRSNRSASPQEFEDRETYTSRSAIRSRMDEEDRALDEIPRSSRRNRQQSNRSRSFQESETHSRGRRGKERTNERTSERSSQRSIERAEKRGSQERESHGVGSAVAGAVGSAASAVGNAIPHKRKQDYRSSIYGDGNAHRIASRNHFSGGERGTVLGGGNYVGTYGNGSAPKSRRVFYIAGAIILVVLLVFGVRALIGAFTSSSSSSSQTTSSVTISGLDDPGSAGIVEEENVVVPIAPTAAVFTYSIDDGESAYIEIYIDDSETPTVAETVDGPARESFDVTGKLYFVTARPSVCTLTVDGTTVEATDDDGDGISTYTVDFNEILEAWKAENNVE